MTDLDQKVRGVRMYLAERAKMRQIDFDQIHGLHVGDAREAVLKATDLTAILDEYDRRGAALVEAAKAIEALQADLETRTREYACAAERADDEAGRSLAYLGEIEALQAEVERLSAAPPAVGREEIAGALRDMAFNIRWRVKEFDEAVAGAADAILSALGRTEALTPPEGDGLTLGG